VFLPVHDFQTLKLQAAESRGLARLQFGLHLLGEDFIDELGWPTHSQLSVKSILGSESPRLGRVFHLSPM
jgi:hypothetical protein